MHVFIRFGSYALGAYLAAAALAACSSGGSWAFGPAGAAGGSESGLTSLARMRDAALTMPHFLEPNVHADRGQSFTRPEKKSGALLYVGDWSTNDVYVYDYPSGTPVGALTGNDEPYGMCVDASGDVYVASFGSGTVNEYAHGGTSPINTYTPGGEPIGCSVSAEGDVAATSFNGGAVTVYAGGDPGKGKTYGDRSCEYMWTMGYDNKGNLIGSGEYDSIDFCALLAGHKKMGTIQEKGSMMIEFPGGTTWDGRHLALSAQESGGTYQTSITRGTIKGDTLTLFSSTTFSDNCYSDYVDDLNPFIVGKTNGLWNHKEGSAMVGPNLWWVDASAGEGEVDYWHYPAGGLPYDRLASPPAEPYGAAVSIASK